MRFLHRVADWLYVVLRFLWRRLPLSWRDRIRHVRHGRHPLRPVLDFPAVTARLVWRSVPYAWRKRASRAWHVEPPTDVRGKIHEDLRRAIHAGPGPSVLMLPLLSWFECGFQRTHQMARALAGAGCPVVFYEPWKVGPGGEGGLALRCDAEEQRQFVGLRTISDHLYLLRVPHWFLAECLVETPPDFQVMTWPHQASFIPRESSSMVVYEMVDDHELLPGVWWWRHIHERWLRDADVVAATAELLLEEIGRLRSDALLLPNGVWVDDWRLADVPPVPPDLEPARAAPVVVAYYGALGAWFDWDLLQAAAAARPDWAFVLIGFPFGLTERELAERLAALPNVHYLGPKPHDELPGYMAHVDVATIPFLLNSITHACSPLKLFEYMAAGKPVVATPMREILKYQSVLFADTADAFVRRLDEAVSKKDDPECQTLWRAEAEANTWRSRAEVLLAALESVCHRQHGLARRSSLARIIHEEVFGR